ncbi:MAG: hypothetical protein ABW022_10945 [Actinoplanes sp.]
MKQLLDDPIYRAYMKRAPANREPHNPAPAWQLWVETAEHKWLTKTYASYVDGWRAGVARYRLGDDFTLTSRRVFYAPPGEWYRVKVRRQKAYVNPSTGEVRTHDVQTRWRQTWFWDDLNLNWCGRCRRPVVWMPLFSFHHALKRLPAVTEEDNYRCIICGIRWIAQPDISQMVKMEPKP